MRASLAFSMALAAFAAAGGQPPLFVNVDNDFMFYTPPETMTEKGLVEKMDAIIDGGGVTDVVLCPCGQRASFDSKAWEPIWMGLGEPDDSGGTNNLWASNCLLLRNRGIDPYAVWTKRIRSRGRRVWLSVRMNDLHFWEKPNYFRITQFWKSRPDLHIDRGKTRDSLGQGFDFSLAEVREYAFAMIAELLERYDTDGIELDWTRFPFYFEAGTERRNAHHLTDVMRRTRKAADAASARLKHRVRVGVRVTSEPEAALGLGMDVFAWAREGLVDLVVPCNFYHASNYCLPYSDWRERITAAGGGKVAVVPGCDVCVGCCPEQSKTSDLAQFAGWLDLMYADGAPGAYVFNAPYLKPDIREPLYTGKFAPGAVSRFPCATLPCLIDYARPRGYPNKAQLPQDTKWDRYVEIRANASPAPARVFVTLALDKAGDAPELALNSIASLGPAKAADVSRCAGRVRKLKRDSAAAYRAEFPVSALKSGMNTVRIGMSRPPRNITWCEIDKEPK